MEDKATLADPSRYVDVGERAVLEWPPRKSGNIFGQTKIRLETNGRLGVVPASAQPMTSKKAGFPCRTYESWKLALRFRHMQ